MFPRGAAGEIEASTARDPMHPRSSRTQLAGLSRIRQAPRLRKAAKPRDPIRCRRQWLDSFGPPARYCACPRDPYSPLLAPEASMKIRSIETFATEFVGFVRVTTDSGAEGWGQVATYHSDITALILHRQVAPWALGRDALDVE